MNKAGRTSEYTIAGLFIYMKMGRKRLTKPCTRCLRECERKQFSRSMWEKDEDDSDLHFPPDVLSVSTVVERFCRVCQFEVKQEKERAALGPAALVQTEKSKSVDLSLTHTHTHPVASPAMPLVNAEKHVLVRKRLHSDASLAASTLTFPNVAESHPAFTFENNLFSPMHEEPMLRDINQTDDFDLGDFPEGDEDDETLSKEKRSLRAKRRRATMNSLFNALAMDVGLPIYADRAKVLERTREVIRELRELKSKSKSVHPSNVTPLVTMSDVLRDHLMQERMEGFSYSPIA